MLQYTLCNVLWESMHPFLANESISCKWIPLGIPSIHISNILHMANLQNHIKSFRKSWKNSANHRKYYKIKQDLVNLMKILCTLHTQRVTFGYRIWNFLSPTAAKLRYVCKFVPYVPCLGITKFLTHVEKICMYKEKVSKKKGESWCKIAWL